MHLARHLVLRIVIHGPWGDNQGRLSLYRIDVGKGGSLVQRSSDFVGLVVSRTNTRFLLSHLLNWIDVTISSP